MKDGLHPDEDAVTNALIVLQMVRKQYHESPPLGGERLRRMSRIIRLTESIGTHLDTAN